MSSEMDNLVERNLVVLGWNELEGNAPLLERTEDPPPEDARDIVLWRILKHLNNH